MIIRITETKNGVETEYTRTFTNDKDAQDFLQKLHDDEMNILFACAGLGTYWESRLTKPLKVETKSTKPREFTAVLNEIKPYIIRKLSIKIEHSLS